MALDTEGIPQAADQIVKLRGNFLAGCLFLRGGRGCHGGGYRRGRFRAFGLIGGRSGARFANLGSYSIQCCFQSAERRAGVLEFCHGPLVYRV